MHRRLRASQILSGSTDERSEAISALALAWLGSGWSSIMVHA